ncbi:VirB3 family type IV secretion system protein [Delftia sp. GW456-R20]|uniref:VirB3 family type IV secretion system protein n=1 Tax=Delftia sp. GW456-R20 TaxID=1827145 RepID=UPI0009ED0D1D
MERRGASLLGRCTCWRSLWHRIDAHRLALRDPIFKGATRPVLWLGVPQMVLLALMLICVLVSMWAFILIGGYAGFILLLAGIFIFAILRFASADDPHRLLQKGKQLESWFQSRRNRAKWGAHCASPHERVNVHISEE